MFFLSNLFKNNKNIKIYPLNFSNDNFINTFDCVNILTYLFHINNYNLLSHNKIPTQVVLQNQKNFFNFLKLCYYNKFKLIFISKFFKKNSLKAFNMLHLFQQLSINSPTIVMILENTLSKSLVSKLVNSKLIFVKPVEDTMDFNLNIYPIFINLSNSFNVFAYSIFLKLFFKNLQKINQYYHYEFFYKNILLLKKNILN